ncbi:DUF937 domain-containing protein [Leptolyngbya sp. AN02str]|uniref:DUF937 domain-containing protein n=1 Tax=Leptolyngbya sp. AN02str TaxID=3423363 RepID=UPI003D31A4A8
MGLFFDILSSINHPNQQGSADQLSTVVGAVQQLSASHGISPSTMQSTMSVLGSLLRPALQQQAAIPGGLSSLEGMLSQVASHGEASAPLLQSWVTPQLQQQMATAIAQRTGLNTAMLQSALPGLVASVMGLLNMGASRPGMGSANPVLEAFLDGDRDEDADLGDVIKFASRFVNVPAS